MPNGHLRGLDVLAQIKSLKVPFIKFMQISEKYLEKYISIYLEEYNELIDKSKARDEITALVCLINAVQQQNNKINQSSANKDN